MSLKQKSVKKGKLPFIFAFAAFVALTYAVVNLIAMQVEISQKSAEYEALSAKLHELRTQNEMLERYAGEDAKLDYVEQIARSEFDYSYPDEKIYYFVPSTDKW